MIDEKFSPLDKDAEIKENYDEPCVATCVDCMGWSCACLCLFTTCGCCCYPYETVNRGFRGVIQRFGQVRGIVNEGLYLVNPCSESIRQIDIRTRLMDLKEQTVLTQDNLTLKIDGVVYYTVREIEKATFNIQNIEDSVYQLSLVSLREVFGTHTLQDCLEKRERVAEEIEQHVSVKTKPWGIKINMIQLTDIVLPEDTKRMLASAAMARRQARAKIILAEADVECAKLIREGAEILNTDAAMQIRVLESYNKLALMKNEKIIFLPLDGLKSGYEEKKEN